MRAIVTGGAGFIGSHLVDALVTRNLPVLVVDDLSTGREANLVVASVAGAGLARVDIRDRTQLCAMATSMRLGKIRLVMPRETHAHLLKPSYGSRAH